MEIRLGTIEDRFPTDNTLVHFDNRISIREFVAVQNALAEINAFKSNQRLIEIVLLNNSEIHYFFIETFKTLLEKSVSWVGIKEKDMEKIYLHSNRLLLNYLSSIRTYLDHSLAFLTKKYGKTSPQVRKYNALLSFNYDNNFSYRFFYKLRNYSQHCGIPIDNLSFKSDYDRDNNQIHGHLNAFFDPNKLLTNFDSWGAKVKVDLLAMNEPFELRSIRESMTAIMFNINVNFKKINSAKTIKAAKYLQKKVAHLKNSNKEICIFYNIQTNDKGHLTKFENIPIPMTEINEILY
jgi:hypothetical protein